ncbi:uncharacterized protein LOC129179240 [Dunckerocampus dactyliophorus]|uniref:uncharacterized protein LOC129179240 n=1 Tax=Dunckerocampus dactyliophorus TaxID=161453 RepID=UPI002406C9A1|nr:uncharacterized protein LOC129179240 [Dunckerocampus dactyliophorus]
MLDKDAAEAKLKALEAHMLDKDTAEAKLKALEARILDKDTAEAKLKALEARMLDKDTAEAKLKAMEACILDKLDTAEAKLKALEARMLDTAELKLKTLEAHMLEKATAEAKLVVQTDTLFAYMERRTTLLLQMLKERVDKLDVGADKHKVMFTATGGDIKKDDKLVFDVVHTNVGNAYNSSTGIFTAPYKGVYFFTLTCDINYGMIELHVFKSSELMMKFYDNTEQKGHSGTNSWMLRLDKEDKVYVKPVLNQNLQRHDKHSVFSGFLVEPM